MLCRRENFCFCFGEIILALQAHQFSSLKHRPLKTLLAPGMQHLSICPSDWPVCMSRTLWGQSNKLTYTHTLCHITLRLWYCSSGGAVTQVGAAALVWDFKCRGNCQTWCHGNWEAGCGSRCKTGRRGDRGGCFIRASVLQKDVNTLLAAGILSQSQSCLPLSVPIPDITAILKTETESITSWISLCNY